MIPNILFYAYIENKNVRMKIYRDWGELMLKKVCEYPHYTTIVLYQFFQIETNTDFFFRHIWSKNHLWKQRRKEPVKSTYELVIP